VEVENGRKREAVALGAAEGSTRELQELKDLFPKA
jgi:hypothetical protein